MLKPLHTNPLLDTQKLCMWVFAMLLCTMVQLPFEADAASEDPNQQKKEQISKGIKKTKINIGRLKEGIKRQEEQLRATKKSELTLLTELQDIDTRLVEQSYKTQTLEARMKQQQEMVFAMTLPPESD